MVVIDGVKDNYWKVLREHTMPHMGSVWRFSESEIEWLASIREQVEAMLNDNVYADGSEEGTKSYEP